MQIKVTHNTPTNVTLSVVTDSETLSKIKNATLKRLNNPQLKIAGFRAGKAPLNMVEKHLDPQTFQSEFIDDVLNFCYVQAVTKEKLRTIGQPSVNLKKFVPFSTFEFEVTVDVLGEVTLPDYRKIRKQKKTVAVDAKDITDVISSLRKRLAVREEVKREAKNGDEVIINFKGVDAKGAPVEGAEGKEFPLVLGSDNFIPGFESNLVGLKAGDEKEFTITFPKDYGVAALKSKKVTFTVVVLKVQALVEPKADDAFAAKAGPFKTLKELKEDIKKELTAERKRSLDDTYNSELLREIAENTKVAIPDSVVDEQIQRMEQEERQNLTYRGQTWEEHLENEGITEEEHRTRNRPDAAEQVKIGVMLGAIGDKENIEVTPEELEIRTQLLKGQYTDPAMQAELDKPEGRQDVASRIRTEKIIALLTEIATKK